MIKTTGQSQSSAPLCRWTRFRVGGFDWAPLDCSPVVAVAVVGVGAVDVVGALPCGRVIGGIGWGLVRGVLVNAVGWGGTFRVISLILASLVWTW